MPVFLSESIGQAGYEFRAPDSAPPATGCAVVVAGGAGTEYDLSWTARPVLQEPAIAPTNDEQYLSPIGWTDIPVVDSAAVIGALGYTPANKAGDTFSGNVSVPRLGIDGFTAANPMLKRSGTILQARLGDDSWSAPFQAASVEIDGSWKLVNGGSSVNITYAGGDAIQQLSNSGGGANYTKAATQMFGGLSYAPTHILDMQTANTYKFYQANGTTLGTLQAGNVDILNPNQGTNNWWRFNADDSPSGYAALTSLNTSRGFRVNAADGTLMVFGAATDGNAATFAINDDSFGFGRYLNTHIFFMTEGAGRIAFGNQGATVPSTHSFNFSSNPSSIGTPDLKLQRVSAGALGVYQADGTTLGTLQANKVSLGPNHSIEDGNDGVAYAKAYGATSFDWTSGKISIPSVSKLGFKGQTNGAYETFLRGVTGNQNGVGVYDDSNNLSVLQAAEYQLSNDNNFKISKSGNSLNLTTWDGFNVLFGNGVGTPLSINNLGSATFTGPGNTDVIIKSPTDPSLVFNPTGAPSLSYRIDGSSSGFYIQRGSAQPWTYSTTLLDFDLSNNATFGGSISTPTIYSPTASLNVGWARLDTVAGWHRFYSDSKVRFQSNEAGNELFKFSQGDTADRLVITKTSSTFNGDDAYPVVFNSTGHALLKVNAGAAAQASGLHLMANNVSKWQVYQENGDFKLYNHATSSIPFTIDSSGITTFGGNVGVNTTPEYKLHVKGVSGTNYASAIARFSASNSEGVYVGYNTESKYGFIGAITDATTHDPLVLQPDGSNVLIGTRTDNGARLQVNGNVAITGHTSQFLLQSDEPSTGSFAIKHIATGRIPLQVTDTTTKVRNNFYIDAGLGGVNEAGIVFQQSGVNKWQLYDSSNRLRLYNYGTSSEVFGVDAATGNATFSGYIDATQIRCDGSVVLDTSGTQLNIGNSGGMTTGVVLSGGGGSSRLMLGGTTNSFPAIKQAGALVSFRLADDSADANITAGNATFSGTINAQHGSRITNPSANASLLEFWSGGSKLGSMGYTYDSPFGGSYAGVNLSSEGFAAGGIAAYRFGVWTGGTQPSERTQRFTIAENGAATFYGDLRQGYNSLTPSARSVMLATGESKYEVGDGGVNWAETDRYKWNAGAERSMYGVTPVPRATTAGAAATFAANTSAIADDTATFDGYTIGQVVRALRNFGILT